MLCSLTAKNVDKYSLSIEPLLKIMLTSSLSLTHVCLFVDIVAVFLSLFFLSLLFCFVVVLLFVFKKNACCCFVFCWFVFLLLFWGEGGFWGGGGGGTGFTAENGHKLAALCTLHGNDVDKLALFSTFNRCFL